MHWFIIISRSLQSLVLTSRSGQRNSSFVVAASREVECPYLHFFSQDVFSFYCARWAGPWGAACERQLPEPALKAPVRREFPIRRSLRQTEAASHRRSGDRSVLGRPVCAFSAFPVLGTFQRCPAGSFWFQETSRRFLIRVFSCSVFFAFLFFSFSFFSLLFPFCLFFFCVYFVFFTFFSF